MTRVLFLFYLWLSILTGCNITETNYLPSEAEREWISQNEVTIGVYPLYPPYAFVEEKQLIVGIFPDIQKVIDKATGLKSKQVFYPSWEQFLEAAENGEIDVISPIIPTKERREFLNFTAPVVMDPHVIVVRDELSAPETLEELQKRKDLKIGVIRDYFITDYVLNNFSTHKIKYYNDDKSCVQALDRKEIDVFMTQQYTSNYFLFERQNLKTISDIPANTILAIGINKNKPMLAEIYVKAIDGISEEDLAKLINNWSYQRYLPFYQKYDFWLLIGLIALLSAFLLLVWNKSLSQRVKRRTRELLEAKQKAEESDRLKTAFVSNISHEIRTPLNAINGYSELLTLEFSDPLIKEYSNNIIANAHRLTSVIESIIIFSQIERGQVKMHQQQSNLNEIINNVKSRFDETFPEKKEKIEFKSSCASKAYHIMIAPYYFRKMLGFLVDNAFKFTEEGEIIIGYELSDEKLTVFVKDTGTGISADQLPKIFEKFYKFSVHGDRFYSGTGVGLTIAQALAELLGFKMDVESTPGKGTTFYFKQQL